MCKPASFVVTRGPKVWWLEKSDSHEDIIHEYKLNADGLRGPNIVRTELLPKNGNLSLPLYSWQFVVDQDALPDWWDAATGEAACRYELKAWAEKKLTGWNVKEAFNPVNPLLLKRKELPTEELVELLSAWASVRASVGASVRASVRASVWASVRDSVGASVWASVRDSVGASAWDSVWDSVWASVRDSVWAYTGGLFPNINVWQYAEKLGPDPWRPLLTLWHAGYVPSFDGQTWRLHAGQNAEVVLEWRPK